MSEIERLDLANCFIEAVASCGRKFLQHEGRTGRLQIDARGRVWWIDHYTQKRVYTHRPYLGTGFCGGGTLNILIVRLRQYVKDAKPLIIPAERHWGYGDDMATVIEKKNQLNLSLQSQPEEQTASEPDAH